MRKIKATRMELLNLRRQFKTAQRGHKLLKEKRDSLMRRFMEIVSQAREERKKMEEQLAEAFSDFALSSIFLSQEELREIFSLTKAKAEIEIEKENVMSVWIPKFRFKISEDIKVWSNFSVPLGVEDCLKKFHQALKTMISLAEKEHALRLLSQEIEKTRRRVNALEYLIIPRIKDQIRYISWKLDEQERADKIIRLKVKEMIGG